MRPRRMPTSSPYPQFRDLTITERTDGGWLVLELAGEVDIAVAPGLAVQVRDHVRRGADAVCIDLTAVDFVDTSGVAALLNAERSLSRVDGRFAVLAPRGSFASSLLEQMGTRGLLTVATSAAELPARPAAA